jgi:hypothetical protein
VFPIRLIQKPYFVLTLLPSHLSFGCQDNLPIQTCFVKEIYHNVALISCRGMKNVVDSVTVQFDGCVLRALLEWLPMIPCCISAGALQWYFLLLSRVMSLDVSATTGQKCVALLQQIAQEMNARSSPHHLLLRTRFGRLVLQ